MKQHQIDFYKDGYQSIEFCKICGADGEKLYIECTGSIEKDLVKEKIKNLWKSVDKIKSKA